MASFFKCGYAVFRGQLKALAPPFYSHAGLYCLITGTYAQGMRIEAFAGPRDTPADGNGKRFSYRKAGTTQEQYTESIVFFGRAFNELSGNLLNFVDNN